MSNSKVSKMRLTAAIIIVAFAASAHAAHLQKRCGWLVNPTPANWWLNDRDGEWILSVQGGYQADGLDNIPDMSEHGQWIVTNAADYGYGCACLTVTVVHGTHRVKQVLAAEALPLSRCNSDRSLRKPQP